MVAAVEIILNQIDVSDPALYQNDIWRPLFARLRTEDPVHYCADSPYGGYWSVTKFDDIMAVELDHNTYSSASHLGGIQISDQPTGKDIPNFLRMDPPQHTAQRRTVAPIVSPTNLSNLENVIRQRTCFVLDGLAQNETIDWVAEVSIPLTTMMLATLFNFPWEDRHKLTYWSDVAIANINSPDALVKNDEERMVVMHEMASYFLDLWKARAKAEPTFDLISMLAHSKATKDMPLPEFIGNIGLLIVGGNDTTRNSMTGGVLSLHDNPNEDRKLREDPSLIGSLIPEIVRVQSPVIHMRRTARANTTLSGKKIWKGDKVVLWYISGNVDETAIEQSNCFIVDRKKARRHLAFGAGIHRCVGDRLAEQQLRILWEEILSRNLKIEVVGDADRLYSNFIRGIRSLPVRITTS